jgi:ubiquinone/menaquinone biosynthesis C-methylase UbiE
MPSTMARAIVLPLLATLATMASPVVAIDSDALTRRQTEVADAARLIELLAIDPGDVVADIGAGSGALVRPIARQVGNRGRLYATDISPERLAELRKLAQDQTLANVMVVEGAAAQTNLPDGCCDAVFMRNVYHHFGDPPAMNASLARTLKPGGRLAVVDFAPKSGRTAPPNQRNDGDTHGVTPETLIAELQASGFVDVEQVTWPSAGAFAVVARRPADGDRENPWRNGQTVLLGTFAWDVETNTQSGKARFDVHWEQVGRGVQNLVPLSGAVVALLGAVPFDSMSADAVRGVKYLGDPVPGASLTPGAVVAIRTAEGNFAKVQVIGFRALHDFSFESATLYPQERRARILARPDIPRYHLEVKWVLYRR